MPIRTGVVRTLFFLNQRTQVFTGYPMPRVNAPGGFTLHFLRTTCTITLFV
jgi:hypothetical protein